MNMEEKEVLNSLISYAEEIKSKMKKETNPDKRRRLYKAYRIACERILMIERSGESGKKENKEKEK